MGPDRVPFEVDVQDFDATSQRLSSPATIKTINGTQAVETSTATRTKAETEVVPVDDDDNRVVGARYNQGREVEAC